jgi:hypothetical protein
LWARAQKEIAQETELYLAPDFFTDLRARFPEIGFAQMKLKRGRGRNELTKFRYDAILRVDQNSHGATQYSSFDWREDNLTLSALREILSKDRPGAVLIKRVPNARVLVEVRASGQLANGHWPPDGDQWRAAFDGLGRGGIDPEDIWEFGESLGYEVDHCCFRHDLPDCFDVAMRPKSTSSLNLFTLDAAETKGLRILTPTILYGGRLPVNWRNNRAIAWPPGCLRT